MKNWFTKIALSFILATACILVACGGFDVVGRWEIDYVMIGDVKHTSEDTLEMQIDFDSIYLIFYSDNTGESGTGTFEWEITDNIMTVKAHDSEGNVKEEDTVTLEIKDGRLVMTVSLTDEISFYLKKV